MNRFLLIHDPLGTQEVLIPIDDIVRISMDVDKCTIDIYTKSGAHYYEDGFSIDGHERVGRFKQIMYHINGNTEQSLEDESWFHNDPDL